MVTAGTHNKVPLFLARERLALLTETLLTAAKQHDWQLQAWAVFCNHYHFVAIPAGDPRSLVALIREIHSRTAREINRADGVADRRVWFQYWDSHLTYPKSYYARLRYVHENAVHHRLVATAAAYPWCSAGWFETKAAKPFWNRIMALPIDRLSVRDDFEVPADGWS